MIKLYLKTGIILILTSVLTACGGGSGDYGYYTPLTYADSPYKSTSDLPEGLYITYRYPFTRINNLIVYTRKNCSVSATNDCIVYSGSPEWLPDSEKFHISGQTQTYYRVSDLLDNIHITEDYDFNMSFESYNYTAKKSNLSSKLWHFAETYPSDKRVWVMQAQNAPRQFWVDNFTDYTFEYALIRFTDNFYLFNFDMWDSNEQNITNRLFAYFEPLSFNYQAYSWRQLYPTAYEVLDTGYIYPYEAGFLDAIPPGLTCVVPLLNGQLNAPMGLAGCQYNLDTPENIDAQLPRSFDLTITDSMLLPY